MVLGTFLACHCMSRNKQGMLCLMPMFLDVSLLFFYCVGMDKDSLALLNTEPLP